MLCGELSFDKRHMSRQHFLQIHILNNFETMGSGVHVLNIVYRQKGGICQWRSKGQITISSDPSPLVGIQFLAIPFAFDFAFKMHISEKSFKHSIN